MTSLSEQILAKRKKIDKLENELYQLKLNLQNENLSGEDELVTVVRKVTHFEEVVMTRKNFDELNKNLMNDDIEEYRDRMNKLNEMMVDAMDFDIELDYYTAFEGDITSGNDDVLGMFDYEYEWADDFGCDSGIPLNK